MTRIGKPPIGGLGRIGRFGRRGDPKRHKSGSGARRFFFLPAALMQSQSPGRRTDSLSKTRGTIGQKMKAAKTGAAAVAVKTREAAQ